MTAALGQNVQPGTAVLSRTGTTRLVTVDLDVSDDRLAKVGASVCGHGPMNGESE